MSVVIDADGETAMKYHDEKQPDAANDYAEEAIPERDPAYRLPPGTDYEVRTIEAVSAELRSDLAPAPTAWHEPCPSGVRGQPVISGLFRRAGPNVFDRRFISKALRHGRARDVGKIPPATVQR